MGYIPPPQPDPLLEAKYGSRNFKDRPPSLLFGFVGIILLLAILGIAVRLA